MASKKPAAKKPAKKAAGKKLPPWLNKGKEKGGDMPMKKGKKC